MTTEASSSLEDLHELVIKLAISGETNQLKEILQQNSELWNMKDWVGLLSEGK